jgi:hypothetical protein
VAAHPASAAAPVRIPVAPSTYYFDANAVCDVPVTYEELSEHGTLTIFDDGRLFGTGAYRVRLTNTDDPTKTLIVNGTGPQMYSETSTRLPAHTLITMFQGLDFMPGIYLATGNLTITRDPDTSGISGIGGVYRLSSNLCDLLE